MRKVLNRREFIVSTASVLGIGAAASLLQACAPAPAPTAAPAAEQPAGEAEAAPEATQAADAPQPAAEKVSLSLWWWVGVTQKAVVEAYMQANPNVEITLADIGENVFGDPKYLTAVAAGSGPDVSIQNRHTFGQFASRKLYKEIEELFTRDGMKREDFFPTQIDEVQWQGKLFGLPTSTDTRFLFYNKKDYVEAGLDPDQPPTTWAELDAATEKLVKKNGDNIDRFGFIPWNVGNPYWIPFVCNGAALMAEDGRKIPSADPDTWVEALEWIVSVFDKYCGGAGTATGFLQGFQGQALDPFQAGKLSQVINGNWVLGSYAALPDLDYGMAPFPVGPHGKKSNISCGYSFVLAPETKQQEAAWQLLKWLIGPDQARAAGTVGLDQAKKTWADQQLPGEPIFVPELYTYKPTVEAVEAEFVSKLPDKIKAEYELTVDALNWTNGCGQTGLAAAEYITEIDRAVQNAINHKATPKEALEAATAIVQKALDDAWAKLNG